MAEGTPPVPRRTWPTRIGRYRILDRIGRGAMGVVYSAHDEVIGREVALKVLMADLEGDPETRARFYREAQAAARLVHPNVITIFDAGEDQGRSFIAMQLLDGSSLTVYMKSPEAAALERKLDLMIQMCEGLAAAHGQGIIHRDLKPNNLFVQSDGLLKILDFGVARLTDSSMTAAGTMLGTPDYMSPEQARGAQVDARSDIFSSGAVFYYMLAGRKPFPGPDLRIVLRQLQFEEPAPLHAGVPPDLAALVLHAMAKNPDDRPGRVEELLASLARFRRQYHAETRRLVLTTRTEYDAIEALAVSVSDAAAALGLPTDDTASTTLHGIRDRFPPLANRGTGSEAIPLERTRVTAVLQELDEQREQLSALLDTRRSHLVQLAAAEHALASDDARGALRILEMLRTACPLSARAQELAETCVPLARDQELRDEKVANLTASARRALDAHDWATAVAESKQALALSPHHELASALLIEAEHAIQREERRLKLVVQRLTDRASRAIDQQQFDDAEVALKEADAVHPGAPMVVELRRRLQEERLAAEAAEVLHQLSTEEIKRARASFRRSRYDEAVQQLRGFLELEPQAHEVERELGRLIALREGIVSSSATARRQIQPLLSKALQLAESGSLAEAVEIAREALRTDPTDADAAALLNDVLTRELEQRIVLEKTRIAQQRTQYAEPLLAAARHALDRGYVAVALKAALAAQRVAPERSDVAAFVDDARRDLAATDDREIFELVATPLPERPVEPSPPVETIEQPRPPSETSGMFDWAAHLLRGNVRRGKA